MFILSLIINSLYLVSPNVVIYLMGSRRVFPGHILKGGKYKEYLGNRLMCV